MLIRLQGTEALSLVIGHSFHLERSFRIISILALVYTVVVSFLIVVFSKFSWSRYSVDLMAQSLRLFKLEGYPQFKSMMLTLAQIPLNICLDKNDFKVYILLVIEVKRKKRCGLGGMNAWHPPMYSSDHTSTCTF